MKYHVLLSKTGQPTLLVLLTAFLYIIASAHSQFVPPKCSQLCGINPNEAKFHIDKDPRFSNSPRAVVDTSGDCARNAGIANWNASSRRFLSSIGMNDGLFDCPKWNAVQRGPNSTEVPRSWHIRLYHPTYSLLNYKFSMHKSPRPTTNQMYLIDLDNVPAKCSIQVDRGVLRRTPDGRFAKAWIIAFTFPGLSGWAFGLLDEDTRGFRWIHAPRNVDDKCRGNRCHRYSALWFVSNTTVRYVRDKVGLKHNNVFSMFAGWKYMQVPGMKLMVEKLKQAISKLEDIDNDFSASNLAILCLPIVMSIPPISLLTEVSDTATVWYVFATDIFAILPLLIKGIELINAYSDARVRVYSTLSMTGKQFGLFERWHISCAPRKFTTDSVGKLIVLLSAWFMFASVYSEFIFWQRAKHKQKHEDRKKVMNSLMDGEMLEMNHYLGLNGPFELEETDPDPDQKRRRNSTIRYIISFLLSVGVVLAIPFTFHVSVFCVGIVLLVFLRAVARRQLRRFLGWKYAAGVIFGFLTGPLYLILHALKSVRTSKGWEDGSDGACVGFASSIAGLYYWLMVRSKEGWPFNRICVFLWLYGASFVLVHMLRNLDEDKVMWRCFGHGVVVGFLFGPFGFLFKRFIHETGTNEEAETYFLLGFGSGLNLLASVSMYPFHFFQPWMI